MKILAFIIGIFISIHVCADKQRDILDSLDMEVAQSNYYIEKKECEIMRLKQNLSVASFPQDRYLSCKQLFIAYSKFNPDSAEYYLRQCYDYGVQSDNREWQQEALLNMALIYTLRCDLYPANNLLKKIGTIENISPPMQEKYAQIKLEEITRLNIDYSMQSYQDSLWQEAWETYSPYLSADNYTIYKTRLVLASCGKETSQELEKILRHCKPDTYERAFSEYAIYQWLTHEGKHEQAFDYLVRSVIMDIRLANRESQSLLEIIRVINKDNDNDETQLRRLYDYTLLCTDNMRLYKDVGRSIKLIEAQKQIQKNYKRLVEYKQHVTHIIILSVCLLLILIFLMCRILCKRYKRKSNDYRDLQAQNKCMHDALTEKQKDIDGLQQQIKEMDGEIATRDKAYIEYLRLNVDAANKTKQFKKRVLNQLVAGRLSEAKKCISESILDEQEVGSLYEQFDAIFLAIHSDFVDRFNDLLRPESRIIPENNNTLTPELRIYALVCMGITDSISIAEYLQYSTQTIYNYRLKIRHASIIPEKSFDEAVANLYLTTIFP